MISGALEVGAASKNETKAEQSPDVPVSPFSVSDIGNMVKESAKHKFERELKESRKLANSVQVRRIHNLIDNIFAFAMTLLVQNLNVPPQGSSYEDMYNGVISNWPLFLGILAILLTCTSFFNQHLFLGAVLRGCDNTIGNLHIALAVGVSLIPFSFSFLIQWSRAFLTPVLISANLFYVSLIMLVIWLWASINRRFVIKDKEKLTNDQINILTINLVLQVLAYALSAFIGVGSTYASVALVIFIDLNFIISSIPRLDVVGRSYFFIKWMITCNKNPQDQNGSANSIPASQELIEYSQFRRIQQHPSVTSSDDITEEPMERSSPFSVDNIMANIGIESAADVVGISSRMAQRAKIADSIAGQMIKQNKIKIRDEEFHENILERLEGLGDNLFSAVITVLVIQLNAPNATFTSSVLPIGNYTICNATITTNCTLTNNVEYTNATFYSITQLNFQLWTKLLQQYPIFLLNLLAFVLIGSFWMTNLHTIRGLIRTNRGLILGNILFLSFVVFLPFSINLLGRFVTEITAAVVLSINVVLIVLMNTLTIILIDFVSKLRDPKYLHLRIPSAIRTVFELIIAFTAFGVSFANVPASLVIILIIPAVEVLSSLRLDLFYWGWRLYDLISDRLKY